MARPIQRPKTRKLLVASIGVGTLTFACCGVFPGCNLMAPPPCGEASGYACVDLAVPDMAPADAAAPADLADTD